MILVSSCYTCVLIKLLLVLINFCAIARLPASVEEKLYTMILVSKNTLALIGLLPVKLLSFGVNGYRIKRNGFFIVCMLQFTFGFGESNYFHFFADLFFRHINMYRFVAGYYCCTNHDLNLM